MNFLMTCAAWAAALLATGVAVAQPAGVATPRAAAVQDGAGFLWEARKGDARLLLLGTVHVGRAQAAVEGQGCERRYGEAQVIAIEADVFDASRVGPLVQRRALFPPAEAGLDTRISADLKRRVEAILPRYGLEPSIVWRMKPWMLGNTLTILEAARNGFDPAYATEAGLNAFARDCGRPLVEIEGVERQLAVFDDASAALQEQILEQTVRSLESGAALREMTRIVTAWETGDLEALERLMREMRAASSAAERFVVERLIDGRHPHMVEVAERLAASGRLHLFAVGALHFVGPKGLLAALHERGYRIRRLP